MATIKEIKDSFRSTLQDLNCNSKPLISVLTMLAEENVAHAKVIVEAIEEHLAKVRTEVKLPVLYLIDCIIKNVSGPYTSAFCNNIVTLFCSVFQVVDEKTRTEMYKLRQTWNDVLPKSKLYALDIQTKQIDPAWPVTAAPPNIHFNPKFLLKDAATLVKKEGLLPKPAINPLVAAAPTETDPTTLGMQQKLILKHRQLLELQQKKIELELLQTQVKLQEQMKKSTNEAPKNPPHTQNLLLKPEVAKQLFEKTGVSPILKQKISPINQRMYHNTSSNSGNTTKIAPVNSILASAVKPIRDPRLLRQQEVQQNTVNSNVKLENKNNPFSNKLINSKMSNRERNEARFLNNKDEPSKLKIISRIPLKSKRSSSPINKSDKSNHSSKFSSTSSAGLGSTSSLDSPGKTKLSHTSKSSPLKTKKSPSSTLARLDKKGVKNKSDMKSPTKDSGFKEIKGITKARNYLRRNRDLSASPENLSPLHHDVDLRIGGPPEKHPRLQSDNEDKCDMSIQGMDMDLRPAVVMKKRPSTESSDCPTAKRSKSEIFDELFGNEDVDLRQQLTSVKSPVNDDRPPTPPPPIISDKPNIVEDVTIIVKNNSVQKESQSKTNLDLIRAKLANATNKEKIQKSKERVFSLEKFSIPKISNTSSDDPINKIIISPADEESIKNGNMTKAQGNALMNKIIAQIENQKLKEAQRKEQEESNNVSLQTISDEELDDSISVDDSERPKEHAQTDEFARQFDSRFRRGQGGNWRGIRRGFPGPRGPIRSVRPIMDPWLKPLNPNSQWRPPFMNPPAIQFDEEKVSNSNIFDLKNNTPFNTNDDDHNIIVNCLNQNTKSINIDNEPRDIVFYDDIGIAFMTYEDPREISFQNGSRRVIFDDKESYLLSFNEPYRDIVYNGHVHKVKLGAPTREIYIDGQYYECYFGEPGIEVYLFGQAVNIKIEGPPPQVKIGEEKRTDLVAGKINLIIDAKTIIPIYLDARLQKFDLNNSIHTLKFIDALQTVLIDDVPFNVQFGGLPKPIFISNKKHFIRFSVLPRGIKPGYVKIRDMEGNQLHSSDNENSQDCPPTYFLSTKVLCVGDVSPDRNSNSPNATFQQPILGLGNLDSLISNVLVAKASSQPKNEVVTGYQIENTHLTNNTEIKKQNIPLLPDLSSTANINDLFQKLVATGIVTSITATKDLHSSIPPNETFMGMGSNITKNSSIIEPLNSMITLPPMVSTLVTKPSIIEKPNFPDIPSLNKPKRQDSAVKPKPIDFSKPATLKVRQSFLIQALYAGMQCSSCGMRFPPENTILYSQHLDWHFRQNRKGKKNIRKASSRRWNYSISDWHNYEEIEDLDEREKCYFENQQNEQNVGANEDVDEDVEIPSIPADPNITDARCEVCCEKFEQYYNEEKEEWHLRMAIRVEDNLTYHPLCYEDYQESLINSTLEITHTEETKENGIPGLEVDNTINTENKEVTEIIIDDVESMDDDIKINEGKDSEVSVKDDEVPEEEDDDVIINEVQPERIILDEYEFKGIIVNDGMPQEIMVKEEPDDGFTDVENFKLGEVKIKSEPNTSDDMIEDVDEIQDVMDVSSEETSEVPNPELVPSMDGNVELNGIANSGISGKIKINISKQLPVIAPKENKDISLEVENSTVEPIDPTQPLPPGEEPVQLNLKPALQGIELKKLPLVNKGSELTGLCSIM